MQTDLYTKSILTLIAACLTFICAKEISFVPTAHAETQTALPVMQVEVTNIPTVRLAREHQEQEYRLPVIIEGIRLPSEDSLPVLIDDIRNGIFNELPVEIK